MYHNKLGKKISDNASGQCDEQRLGRVLHLSRSSGGVSNTTLTTWTPTFPELCELLQRRPELGDKDGEYFVRGPFVEGQPTRSDANIECASVLVTDGDSSFDPKTGEVTEGAPPPIDVHNALVALDIAHALYTTHSHGQSGKGNRYRILIPANVANKTELEACLGLLFDQLHAEGCWLANVKENGAWSQPWFSPRLASEDSEYLCYTHETGREFGVPAAVEWYQSEVPFTPDALEQVTRVPEPREYSPPTPGALDNSTTDIASLLEYIDPDCGYDDWRTVLMAAHHETGGDESGFQLVDAWSSKGHKYPGPHELEKKWRSFDGHTGVPVTLGSICKLAIDNGADLEALSEEFFDPIDDDHCTDEKPEVTGNSAEKETSTTVLTSKKQPIPLTSALPPVKPLVAEMLPKSFVGFVTDVSRRLQIPADYIAVCAIPVAAGIVGAKYRIHPKQRDDWLVTPTKWAGLVGPPSSMKSACMGASLQPLYELEKELAAIYAESLTEHQLDCELAEDHLKDVKKKAKAIYAKDRDKAIQTIRDAEFTDAPPTRQRYVINDATIEKVGELMRENPNGLLLVRDELTGWFSKMVQEDYQGDRAFYLECFEGNSRFVWDRIGRGTIENENCVLSIIGGIQPSKIAPVIRNAIQGTVDDGLIQRFQLLVWPDVKKGWKWIDQKPDQAAYASYRDALYKLHELPGPDPEGSSTNLRFSKPAQALYIDWMERVQAEIRSDQLHPVMQSHLAKMPKTVAGLALLFELIDGGRSKVRKAATEKAIMWADYLASHANRLYSLSAGQGITGAKLIFNRRDKLPEELFFARDVQRKNWTGLTSKDAVADALDCLVDHRYLSELPGSTTSAGGRPSKRYRWHPSVRK